MESSQGWGTSPRPQPPADFQRRLCLPGAPRGSTRRIWFHPPRLCRGPWGGGGGAFPDPGAPPPPAHRALPRPAPGAPGLPLGRWHLVAQPAWQHLRLPAHWASERHSCVQFRSACSWGHTPGFFASSPARRTVSPARSPSPVGRPPPAPRAAISSSKEFSVSGPRHPLYGLQRAPPPGLGVLTPGSTGVT